MIPQDIEEEIILGYKQFPIHAVHSQRYLFFHTVIPVSIVLNFENSAIRIPKSEIT